MTMTVHTTIGIGAGVAGVFRGCIPKQPYFYQDYDNDGFFIVVTLHEKKRR